MHDNNFVIQLTLEVSAGSDNLYAVWVSPSTAQWSTGNDLPHNTDLFSACVILL